MDTTFNLPASAALPNAPAPVTAQAITRKVTPVDASNSAATRPAEKPFVAQVVSARLSGADYPQNPSEITPADRTLRPYDVPMLPADGSEVLFAEAAQDTADPAAALDARDEP